MMSKDAAVIREASERVNAALLNQRFPRFSRPICQMLLNKTTAFFTSNAVNSSRLRADVGSKEDLAGGGAAERDTPLLPIHNERKLQTRF